LLSKSKIKIVPEVIPITNSNRLTMVAHVAASSSEAEKNIISITVSSVKRNIVLWN